MVVAGRRSRWVEAERKERQRNTSFAAPPDGNRAAHCEKTQPARKPCCCRCVFSPCQQKKSASWPALNWLHLFFCVFVSGWVRIQLTSSQPGGMLFYLSFYYSSLFELVHVLFWVRTAAQMRRRNRAARTLSGSTRSAGKEHKDNITAKSKHKKCCHSWK